MRPSVPTVLAVVLVLTATSTGHGTEASSRVHLRVPNRTVRAERVHAGLNFPTALRFAPDGTLFYTELQTGRIMRRDDPYNPIADVWATVPVDAEVGTERGLLGLALHPDYPDSPYVYVYHSHPNPLTNRVARIQDRDGVGTNYTVFFGNLPAQSGIHHGGRLAFGPDGMLYVTYGDQDNRDLSQQTGVLPGKIFRLGRGGKPAPGNPFGPTNPAAFMGIRNVFGICFDPQDGTGYFTENGPTCDDEVNVLSIGQNYGWGMPTEACGSYPDNSMAPLLSFTPTIAPTGCVLYRGTVHPQFNGNLLFGSFNDGVLYRAVFAPGSVTDVDTLEVLEDFDGHPVLDVTVAPNGVIWVCTDEAIFRVLATPLDVEPQDSARLRLDIGPNPFATTVSLGLPTGARFDRVEILDLLGRQVRAWNGPLASRLIWDGRDQAGRSVGAGMYVVRAIGDAGVVTGRMVKIGR